MSEAVRVEEWNISSLENVYECVCVCVCVCVYVRALVSMCVKRRDDFLWNMV